jgi:hypothetical protein
LKLISKTKTPTERVTFGLPRLKEPPIVFPRLKGKAPSRKPTGLFGVQVRRYGEFRPIGQAQSIRQAISIGRERVGKTLGATFKIIPSGRITTGVRTPKGFKQKKGLVFIEQPKLRLSTRGEVGEIKIAKRRKRKRK